MSHSLDKQSKDELEYDSWKERGAVEYGHALMRMPDGSYKNTWGSPGEQNFYPVDAVRRIPHLKPQPSTPPSAPVWLKLTRTDVLIYILAYLAGILVGWLWPIV